MIKDFIKNNQQTKGTTVALALLNLLKNILKVLIDLVNDIRDIYQEMT